jgi:hypothetical protein
VKDKKANFDVFVFGSNLAGRHGAAGAKHARENYGARYGVGVGRTGDAYAIPTKDHGLMVLPLDVIALHIRTFIAYAANNPELKFGLTHVGCGLSGYDWESDIRPLFPAVLPDNVLDISE